MNRGEYAAKPRLPILGESGGQARHKAEAILAQHGYCLSF